MAGRVAARVADNPARPPFRRRLCPCSRNRCSPKIKPHSLTWNRWARTVYVRGLCGGCCLLFIRRAVCFWVSGAGLCAALDSPDVVKALYAAGLTDEAQVRAVQRQWEGVLFGLVETTMSLVDPNSRAGWADKLDFLHYVKIKTVPGGVSKYEWPTGAGPPPPQTVLDSLLPGECEFIDGVMFRKSLPHKQMRDNIEHPRVLLLDGGCCTR